MAVRGRPGSPLHPEHYCLDLYSLGEGSPAGKNAGIVNRVSGLERSMSEELKQLKGEE
jgi:hypothetical protein